jgi:hypothetical protein
MLERRQSGGKRRQVSWPSPYLKNGFWVTSAGGVPHQKLCEESKGKKFAKLCLARLLVTRADRSRQNILGEPATVAQVYEDYLNVKKAENEEASSSTTRPF